MKGCQLWNFLIRCVIRGDPEGSIDQTHRQSPRELLPRTSPGLQSSIYGTLGKTPNLRSCPQLPKAASDRLLWLLDGRHPWSLRHAACWSLRCSSRRCFCGHALTALQPRPMSLCSCHSRELVDTPTQLLTSSWKLHLMHVVGSGCRFMQDEPDASSKCYSRVRHFGGVHDSPYK